MLQRFRKWFKVDRTDNINYSDRIVRFIVKTTYAKKKFSSMLLMIITVLIRFQIDTLCSIYLKFNNPYIDFWIQIFFSVLLVIKSDWIYHLVEKFNVEITAWTTNMINNYTEEKYTKWKRIITFSICINVMIILFFVEVTSTMLQLAILQYMICYIMIEIIEKKMYTHVVRVFDSNEPKKKTFTHSDSDLKINYSFSPEINESERTPHVPFELDKDLFNLNSENNSNTDTDTDTDPPKTISNQTDQKHNDPSQKTTTNQTDQKHNDPPPLKIHNSENHSPKLNEVPPSPALSIQSVSSTSSTSSSPRAGCAVPPPTPLPTPKLASTPVSGNINLNQCLKENHVTASSSGTYRNLAKDHSLCDHTSNQPCEKIFIVNDGFTFRRGTINSSHSSNRGP